MLFSRYLLLPVLASATLLLTGSFNPKAAPSTPPALPAEVDPLDESGTPGGLEVFDATAQTYAPERVPWMQLTLWQQVHADDLTYVAQGRYLCAPGNRMRLDVKVQVGQTEGAMQMISDGSALLCSSQFDRNTPPEESVLELTQKNGDAERILQENGCLAILPLLRTMRQGIQEPHWKKTRWKGHDIIQLTGRWRSGSAGPAAMRGKTANLRQCRIYVDARTLWPYRLEWWGPPQPGEANAPLIEVEYRDPVLNQPPPPERLAEEFAVKRKAAAPGCKGPRLGP